MTNPKCIKCNNESVKSMANFKEFYYCRICKEEVMDTELKRKMLWDKVDKFTSSLPWTIK